MSRPTASKVIKYAEKWIRRSPYGSPNIFTKWYYGNNTTAPWCAIFVYYCLAHCGGKELMSGCKNKAYVPTVYNWAKAKGYLKKTGKKGDLVIFDWQKDGVADHEGFIVKDNDDGTVTTIEGNTSSTSNGNGGCCQRRVRSKKLIKAYVRLPYAKATKKASSKKKTGKVIAKAGLNVRAGAGTKYRVLKTLKKGTRVTCYGVIKKGKQTWWKIGKGKYVCAINNKVKYIK